MAGDQQPSRSFERYSALPETSFGNELALIAFTIFSGLCGLWTESASVTATIFGGGILTWFAYTFPDQLRKYANQKQADAAGVDGVAAAKSAQTHSSAPAATSTTLQPDATLALIASRRSIKGKDFAGLPVERALVERVLEAANWAPSHKLTQPWRFIVFEGDGKIQLLDATEEAVRAGGAPPERRTAALEKLAGKRQTLAKVPYLIAVGMKAQAVPGTKVAESEEICATACAVQNMHLMATSLGLAGFWDSWAAARESDQFKAWLGLLPEDRCLGVFYLGRSEQMAGYRGSRGPWQDKVTWRS